MLNWVITFLLLSLVGGFFVFAGTGGEVASLLGRITAAGSLAVAVVILATRLWHRRRQPKAG